MYKPSTALKFKFAPQAMDDGSSWYQATSFMQTEALLHDEDRLSFVDEDSFGMNDADDLRWKNLKRLSKWWPKYGHVWQEIARQEEEKLQSLEDPLLFPRLQAIPCDVEEVIHPTMIGDTQCYEVDRDDIGDVEKLTSGCSCDIKQESFLPDRYLTVPSYSSPALKLGEHFGQLSLTTTSGSRRLDDAHSAFPSPSDNALEIVVDESAVHDSFVLNIQDSTSETENVLPLNLSVASDNSKPTSVDELYSQISYHRPEKRVVECIDIVITDGEDYDADHDDGSSIDDRTPDSESPSVATVIQIYRQARSGKPQHCSDGDSIRDYRETIFKEGNSFEQDKNKAVSHELFESLTDASTNRTPSVTDMIHPATSQFKSRAPNDQVLTSFHNPQAKTDFHHPIKINHGFWPHDALMPSTLSDQLERQGSLSRASTKRMEDNGAPLDADLWTVPILSISQSTLAPPVCLVSSPSYWTIEAEANSDVNNKSLPISPILQRNQQIVADSSDHTSPRMAKPMDNADDDSRFCLSAIESTSSDGSFDFGESNVRNHSFLVDSDDDQLLRVKPASVIRSNKLVVDADLDGISNSSGAYVSCKSPIMLNGSVTIFDDSETDSSAEWKNKVALESAKSRPLKILNPNNLLCKAKSIKPVFTTHFRRDRESVTNKTFAIFNNSAFNGSLIAVPLVWSAKLQTTAGVTRLKEVKSLQDLFATRSATIELSSKVLDSEARLRATLLHEMCHAAAWIVDGVCKPSHGKCFKKWAQIAMRAIPDVEVTTKHDYVIKYKYAWICTNVQSCGIVYRRQSRSIDDKTQVCGSCRCTLQEVEPSSVHGKKNVRTEVMSENVDDTDGVHFRIRSKPQPSAYNLFVKEWAPNIRHQMQLEYRRNGNGNTVVTQADVMRECARMWRDQMNETGEI
jgi:predicted SprT family Zn-dependent metalloprotease